MNMRLPGKIVRLLPRKWTYGDRLTALTKRLLWRAALGAIGITVGLTALVLVNATNWREVLAGAVLAWGTAMVAWATGTHRRERAAIETTSGVWRRSTCSMHGSTTSPTTSASRRSTSPTSNL